MTGSRAPRRCKNGSGNILLRLRVRAGLGAGVRDAQGQGEGLIRLPISSSSPPTLAPANVMDAPRRPIRENRTNATGCSVHEGGVLGWAGRAGECDLPLCVSVV